MKKKKRRAVTVWVNPHALKKFSRVDLYTDGNAAIHDSIYFEKAKLVWEE